MRTRTFARRWRARRGPLPRKLSFYVAWLCFALTLTQQGQRWYRYYCAGF